jgi:hypothetical protein
MAEKKFSWKIQISGAGRHAMSATMKMMIFGVEAMVGYVIDDDV